MAAVHLTRRALHDIERIDRYSVERWGEVVASKYLADLHAGLARLEDAPGLLQRQPDSSLRLRFYPVREHVFICDVFEGNVIALAVWHAAMDLPRRLAELEPQLVIEAELLATRIEAKR